MSHISHQCHPYEISGEIADNHQNGRNVESDTVFHAEDGDHEQGERSNESAVGNAPDNAQKCGQDMKNGKAMNDDMMSDVSHNAHKAMLISVLFQTYFISSSYFNHSSPSSHSDKE